MKNKITFVIFIFIGIRVSLAQISVTGGSSVYVTNELLFVTDQIELSTVTDNITLRDEAQLIQGNSGITNNTGLGYISLFQEGIANPYHFNYWSSPVGNSTNNVLNNPFKIELLRDGDATSASFGDLVNFTTDLESTWSPLTISKSWLYTYETSGWNLITETTDINPGNGFLLKGTNNSGNNNGASETVSGQRYEFRGKPNNGNISISTINGSHYLLGNPYPSALDADQFILDNSAIIKDNTLYFWDQWGANSHNQYLYSGNYATYMSNGLGGGVAVAATTPLNGSTNNSDSKVPTRYIPIAQGFFIEADATGTLNFTNSQRPEDILGSTSFHDTYKESASGSTNGSVFLKSSTNNKSKATYNRKNYYLGDNIIFPTLAFNIEVNHQFSRTLLLILRSDASEQAEIGLDAEMFSDLPSDAFWVINDSRYNIQSDSYNTDKQISIGFTIDTDGEFKISINANEYNAPEDVYLYDDLLNTEYLLTDQKTISLLKGEYKNRFEIRFESSVSEVSNDFNIYYNIFNKELIVNNPKSLNLNQVEIFDITGKKVFISNNLNVQETYTFSLDHINNGFYIVRTITKDGSNSIKKIIIDQ